MADVFISYARRDRPYAERLARALEREGFNVWWDIEALRSGQSFNRAIQQALEGTTCVVVLWSATSTSSRYVEAEAYWSWEHEKLHSVRLDDNIRLPVPFNTVHARSLGRWRAGQEDPELQRLIEDLRAAGAGTKPQTPSAGEPEPSSRFRDPLREGGEGPEMLVLPAGRFWMGSPENEPGRGDDEGPRHEVAIPRGFALGVTPVTFADYDRFVQATGSKKPNDEGWGRGTRPVIGVSWEDAVAYAAWLTKQTGKPYRLPSEAEWEYACRAGTETPWSFGDQKSELGVYAWYEGNADRQTHPVGEKRPNPWGLCDMHGNVWEWVEDCWHEDYEGAPTDSSAWLGAGGGECGGRVERGGSWFNVPEALRSAYRGGVSAVFRDGNLGFRLAQDL
jgi:formylglycine-generating enzyme required for sulfatase activity